MYVTYPKDLLKPIKNKSPFIDEATIIIPYKINTIDKHKSHVLCLAYRKGLWYDPLIINPKYGLDLTWDTDEWELIDDIPDKEKLIELVFNLGV